MVRIIGLFSMGSRLNPYHTGLVEQVRDGSTLRVRLFMPDGEHQVINIALAGVRCARAASKQGEPSEPWGEEVSCPPSLYGASEQFYHI
jgi:endonuclease YncB( thermonuclease family)